MDKYKFIADCCKDVEKLCRYRHHIIFLSTYLRIKVVPKGFVVNFHNNWENLDLGPILKNCSIKLMAKIASSYRIQISVLTLQLEEKLKNGKVLFPIDFDFIFNRITEKSNSISNILEVRRRSKFRRDNLDINRAEDISRNILQKYEPLFSLQTVTKADILADVVLPDYSPVNLSTNVESLPSGLVSLCSKGPTFVPTPSYYDWLQMQIDFDNFKNAVRRKVYFAKKQSNHVPDPDKPKVKSKWEAPKCNTPEVETFLNLIERDLFANTDNKTVKDNLTSEERTALLDWRKNVLFDKNSNDLLRMQDKGKRFIYVDKQTDMAKTQVQIDNSNFVTVNEDRTQTHINKVKKWTEKWHKKGQISDDWKAFIVKDNATPGKNTPLYKTHKEGIPVRLLTSGCNTAIENLSTFVDKVCLPLSLDNEMLIKDTSHLLNKIDEINQNSIPEGTLLVSFDIVNMYPSIDNETGIAAVKAVLNRRGHNVKPSTQCVIEALHICLHYNNSVFAGNHLLQENGTAMGTHNSCSYSDIALQPIDNSVKQANSNEYREIMFFGRFRDDCISLWNGHIRRLSEFFLYLNTLDPHLKFTMEIGKRTFKSNEFTTFLDNPNSDVDALKQMAEKELTFLDLRIYKENGKLETTVFSKPTDSHLFLHGASCHKKASISGTQKGTALRLRRICSTEEEYKRTSKNYKAYLVNRGHETATVIKNFEKIDSLSRNEARQKSVKNFSSDSVIFCSTYNPHGPNIKNVIRKHSKLLYETPGLEEIFPTNCIKLSTRRSSNLKELLTRADPYAMKDDDPSPHGYRKCISACDSCQNYVREGNSFKCKATGRKFKIKRDTNCKSENVIYVAFCKVCDFQGVGSTVKWLPRLRNYKCQIKNFIGQCRINKHFFGTCRGPKENPTSNLFFMLVDCLNNVGDLSKEEIDNILLQREKWWIGTLVTQHRGMNGKHDWNRKKRCELEK